MRKLVKIPLISFGFILGIFILFCIVAIATYEPPTAEELASERAEEVWRVEKKNKEIETVVKAAQMVLSLKDFGIVTDFKENKVWVNRRLWFRLPKSDQELFMETYGKGLPAMKKKGFSSCGIYDHITGKRIVWCLIYGSGEVEFFEK